MMLRNDNSFAFLIYKSFYTLKHVVICGPDLGVGFKI